MTSSSTSTISKKAKDTAAELSDAAKDTARAHAEEAKAHVSERVEQSAENFHEASRAFEGNDLAADAVAYLGDNLSYAATAVRDLDLSTIQQDVTQFARRNPLVFFGGAAVVGFLAARAVKASERSSDAFAAPAPYAPTPATTGAARSPAHVPASHPGAGWGYS